MYLQNDAYLKNVEINFKNMWAEILQKNSGAWKWCQSIKKKYIIAELFLQSKSDIFSVLSRTLGLDTMAL